MSCVRWFLVNKLLIDTSTQALIIILEKNRQLDFVFKMGHNNHSETLMKEIEQLMERNKMKIAEIDAFYVGNGPGSYTGVRVGVTVAKTFAYTLNKPLYFCSSLKILAASYKNKGKWIIPTIDARRGNAFSALYEGDTLLPQIEEGLYPIDQLLKKVKAKKSDSVLIVGLDHSMISLIDQPFTIKSDFEGDLDPQSMMSLDFFKVGDLHAFSPDYKRITEAEANVLSKN